MKNLYHMFFVLLLTPGATLKGQTHTLNWNSSFVPAWIDGQTSGTAPNIAASGTQATVTLYKSSGVYAYSLGSTGVPTPTVSGSPYTIAGSSSNLEVAMDFDHNAAYTDIVYQFSAPVTGVRFQVGDIDKPSPTDHSYLDEIEITDTDGNATHHPLLTRFDATTDPDFLVISGHTAHANHTLGYGGNTTSTEADQKGTVIVEFGSKVLTSLTIRYKNAAGALSNPPSQEITIGNLDFTLLGALPVAFTAVKAKTQAQQTILFWQTSFEEDNLPFEVEKSPSGQQWHVIGVVPARGASTSLQAYSFTDPEHLARTVYYRIGQKDHMGNRSYSATIRVEPTADPLTMAVCPHP